MRRAPDAFKEPMRIAVIGRGNVGGGLARKWREAGHVVEEIGSDGGDASAVDVVLLAVPGGAVEDALANVDGLAGKPTIDATNVTGERDESFPSNAHKVKSIVGGPVAKAFNLNFAVIYDRIPDERARPSNLFAADDEARAVTEELSRDAGYDPVYAGDLDRARVLEDHLALMFAVNRGGLGPFFYRIAAPGDL
jgi:8-hydroxy-5-deazaflavin:NADPH oxidoreductase